MLASAESDAMSPPAIAPAECVTLGYPTILHCFVAHSTELRDIHRDEIESIALLISNKSLVGKRYQIRIVGHAATWRGISTSEYNRCAKVRARNIAGYLRNALARCKLHYTLKIAIESRSNTVPLFDKRVSETNRTARRNRSYNRRVEIFLDTKHGPPRKPEKPNPQIDWNAFLNTKLRALEEHWNVQYPFIKDRVHACVRRKLLHPRVPDT